MLPSVAVGGICNTVPSSFYDHYFVKKIYSDFFTNEIREIEAGRQCITLCRPSDKHERGPKTAHIYGLCAAFQPLKGPIFAPERLTFAQKEAPRDNKALTFFHGDIPFFMRGGSLQAVIRRKLLSVNGIATPLIFRLFARKESRLRSDAILSHVKPLKMLCFVKIFFCVVIKGLKNVNIF